MILVNEIQRLYDEYGSISRVSRELKISRNTVRKYLHRIQEVRNGFQEELVFDPQKPIRPKRIVTPQLIEFVHRKLDENKSKPRKQRLSALDIHRLAQASGHQVGYSSVKKLVYEWKQSNDTRDIYVLQDPPEGHRAEFDWGYADLVIHGSLRKIPLAIFILNFSQYRFGKLYPSQTTFDVIQAHVDFFEDIGAVPQTIVYDNATTIYDRRTDRYNSSFLLCATHYGFEPKVCNCASPHEKGSCEKSVSVVRRAAFCEQMQFETLDEANIHLSSSLNGLNRQQVYRRTKESIQLLEDERPYLLPLPVLKFSNYELRKSSINRYGLVQFQNNFYSVPETYSSKSVLLKIYADRIEMLENDEIIATHIRLSGIEQYSLQLFHYLKVLKKKPGSLRNSRLLRSQDQVLQDLFDQHYADRPKDFLQVLDLLKEFSSEKICNAIQICKKRELPPTPDMLKLFISEPDSRKGELFELNSIQISIPDPDLRIFDKGITFGDT